MLRNDLDIPYVALDILDEDENSNSQNPSDVLSSNNEESAIGVNTQNSYLYQN